MTSFLNSIGKRKKSPEQVVLSAKQALQSLLALDTTTPVTLPEREEDKVSSVLDSLSKAVGDVRNILCGSAEIPEVDEEKALELCRCLQEENLWDMLLSHLVQLPPDIRKEVVCIYGYLVKKNVGSFVEYLADNTSLLDAIICGYGTEAALCFGTMLRDSLRQEVLARHILSTELVWEFFTTYVHSTNFEVASDAFNTLKELLTVPKHKIVAEEFLEKNCDKLLEKYDILLQSDNYVTRRRSLKLLSEILLDRNNYTVMMRYISSKHNLKTIMNLLRHKSSQIQFETFHVFKIFVANPVKAAEIESTLYNNRAKLIAYLETFHNDNQDPQFVDEKRLLIDTLQQMAPPEGNHSSSALSSPVTSREDRSRSRSDAHHRQPASSSETTSDTTTTLETVVTSDRSTGINVSSAVEEDCDAQVRADGTESSRCLC